MVLAERAHLWKDPDSIRDARAGVPYACRAPTYRANLQRVNLPASCLCVELNARNSYGGYVGIKRNIVAFPETGGLTILNTGLIGADQYCHGLQPFPELNGGARITSKPTQR